MLSERSRPKENSNSRAPEARAERFFDVFLLLEAGLRHIRAHKSVKITSQNPFSLSQNHPSEKVRTSGATPDQGQLTFSSARGASGENLMILVILKPKIRQTQPRASTKITSQNQTPPPLLVSLSKNHPLRKAHFGCASEPRTTNVRERGRHELRKI